MNIYKYTVGGEQFYLTISDAGEYVEQRNSLDVDMTPEEIIVHLVHKLTATEMQATVIGNQCKEISEALAIINDQRTKIRHGLS